MAVGYNSKTAAFVGLGLEPLQLVYRTQTSHLKTNLEQIFTLIFNLDVRSLNIEDKY